MEAKQGSAMELRSLGHEVDHGKQPQFIPTVLQVPSSKGPLNSSQLWECMNDIKYLSRPADFLVGVFMDADRIEDSGGSKAVTNPGPGSQERQVSGHASFKIYPWRCMLVASKVVSMDPPHLTWEHPPTNHISRIGWLPSISVFP